MTVRMQQAVAPSPRLQQDPRPVRGPERVWTSEPVVAAGLLAAGMLAVVIGLRAGVRPLAAVVGLALFVLLWQRPRLAFALVLVLGATVFPLHPHYLSFGPIQTDGVEVLVDLLLARAVLGYLATSRRERVPLRCGLLLLGVAVVLGSVVAHRNGADVRESVRWCRDLMTFTLALAVVGLVRTRRSVEALRSLVLSIATVGSVVVLVAALLGYQLNAQSATDVVITLGQAADVERLRPALLLLLLLAIPLLLAEASTWGWTWARRGQLALFVALELVSFNRSSWVPLVGITVIYYVVAPGDRVRRRRLAALVVPSTAAVVIAAFVLALSGALGGGAAAVADRAASVANGSVGAESSYQDRLAEDRAALVTLRHHWLLGNGTGRPFGLAAQVGDASTGGITSVPQTFIHNSYLGVLLDFGLLGAVAFLLVAAGIVRLVVRAMASLPPAVARTQLATGLALLAFAASSYLQTILLDRPPNLVWGTALTLLVATDRAHRSAVPDADPPESAPPRRLRAREMLAELVRKPECSA